MSFIPALSVLTSVYHGEDFLALFLDQLRSQTLFPESEIVLVLNEPNSVETQVAKNFASRYSNQSQIVSNERVESLGASWNRAWQKARAPYLAIWNVDDRRTPDSLGRQLGWLEQNLDSVLCYGDYVKTISYGSDTGQVRHTPNYTASHFSRAFAQGGAFWVFRRDLAAQVGYFDEQFRVGSDMDLSFRIAARGLSMGRCEGLLGYFTDSGQGLSTQDGAQRSAVERTAIQLRYGVFDKVRPELANEAREFRLDSVKSFDNWHSLSGFLPNYRIYLQRRQPLWILGRLRTMLRTLLGRLRLLQTVSRILGKYWQREI